MIVGRESHKPPFVAFISVLKSLAPVYIVDGYRQKHRPTEASKAKEKQVHRLASSFCCKATTNQIAHSLYIYLVPCRPVVALLAVALAFGLATGLVQAHAGRNALGRPFLAVHLRVLPEREGLHQRRNRGAYGPLSGAGGLQPSRGEERLQSCGGTLYVVQGDDVLSRGLQGEWFGVWRWQMLVFKMIVFSSRWLSEGIPASRVLLDVLTQARDESAVN